MYKNNVFLEKYASYIVLSMDEQAKLTVFVTWTEIPEYLPPFCNTI